MVSGNRFKQAIAAWTQLSPEGMRDRVSSGSFGSPIGLIIFV
jgi:hypothetical protein